eukprot:TRINITY_DN1414_c0_g1_i1.p1 TRINITY_DN1414_c0_g1~~TRINITY_DN1414_c0_g1_i1.p1  ORF type:complete len:141 (+),score=33.62 TRINITY_DN1414_c0_g1_i1:125-547(+)
MESRLVRETQKLPEVTIEKQSVYMIPHTDVNGLPDLRLHRPHHVELEINRFSNLSGKDGFEAALNSQRAEVGATSTGLFDDSNSRLRASIESGVDKAKSGLATVLGSNGKDGLEAGLQTQRAEASGTVPSLFNNPPKRVV